MFTEFQLGVVVGISLKHVMPAVTRSRHLNSGTTIKIGLTRDEKRKGDLIRKQYAGNLARLVQS
jgi:hypothetical protein